MATSDEGMYPILDRKTPVLDRIRKRRGSEGLGQKLGRKVGRSIMEEDGEKLQRERTEAVEGFRRGLAEELGVSVTDINENVSADIGELMVGLREEDVLTDEALQELGLGNERVHRSGEEESEGEEEDSEPEF